MTEIAINLDTLKAVTGLAQSRAEDMSETPDEHWQRADSVVSECLSLIDLQPSGCDIQRVTLEALKAGMVARNMSATKLAGLIGVSQPTMNAILRGESPLTLERLEKIAAARVVSFVFSVVPARSDRASA